MDRLTHIVEVDIDAQTSPELRAAQEVVEHTAQHLANLHLQAAVALTRLGCVRERSGDDIGVLLDGLDDLAARHDTLRTAHLDLLPGLL